MATHDYVIANGTGAAVRSDLNNALAAIVSNNSGSSEPSTTYAYQWWADTNANVLKIRNSANNAWITLRELDGTMLLEDGSAGSPALAFASDTNTGLFRDGTDSVALAAGGAERFSCSSTSVIVNQNSDDVDFRVESNNQTHMLYVDGGADCVGIGVSNPGSFSAKAETLVLAKNGDHVGITLDCDTDKEGSIYFADGGSGDNLLRGQIVYNHDGDSLRFVTNASERARIDSSGRLLVGLTSDLSGGTSSTAIQISTAGGGFLGLARDDSTISASNSLGGLRIYSNAPSGYNKVADLRCEADGTFASSDYPSRWVFTTTADGASSPTERVRISQNGAVGIGTTSNSNRLRIHEGSDTPNVVIVTGADESSEFLALGIDGGAPSVTAGGVGSTSASLIFRTADNGTESEGARFDKDGRLLIGTTSVLDSNSTVESYKASGQNHVRVQSNSLANGQYSMFRAHGIANSNTRQAYLGVYKHSGITSPGPFLFLEAEDGANNYYWADNSNKLRTSTATSNIGTTGGGLVGTQTSDLRLKNVGANVSYGLAEVKQLQPKQYALKTEPDVNCLGFIAQEVEPIIPEAVYDTLEELPGHQDGDRTKLGMEYVQLIPVLVNAIKELSAEVDTLKTKVAALEAG